MIFHIVKRSLPKHTVTYTHRLRQPAMAALVTSVQNQAVGSAVEKFGDDSKWKPIVVGNEKNLGSNSEACKYTLIGHMKRDKCVGGMLRILRKVSLLFKFFRKNLNADNDALKEKDESYQVLKGRIVFARRFLCWCLWKKMQKLIISKQIFSLKLYRAAKAIFCTIDTIPSLFKSYDLFPLVSRIGIVVLDEAGRVAESKIPLIAITGAISLIAVGDQKQLDPYTHIKEDERTDGQRPIEFKSRGFFQRLHKAMEALNLKIPMLKVQYRMHSHICNFVSEHLYDGLLRTDENTRKCRNDAAQNVWAIWMDYSIQEGAEDKELNSSSWYNDKEVDILRTLLTEETTIRFLETKSIYVITFYNMQKAKIETMIDEIMITDRAMGRNCAILCRNLRVMSVDSAQGCEADVVILSCVRCNHEREIGFLHNKKRICVALSRAKERLIIIGNSVTLRVNQIWSSLYFAQGCKRCFVSEEEYHHDFLPTRISGTFCNEASAVSLHDRPDETNNVVCVRSASTQGVLDLKTAASNLLELVAIAGLAKALNGERFSYTHESGSKKQKKKGVGQKKEKVGYLHVSQLVSFVIFKSLNMI